MVEQLVTKTKSVDGQASKDKTTFDEREPEAGRKDVAAFDVSLASKETNERWTALQKAEPALTESVVSNDRLYVPPLANDRGVQLSASLDGVGAKLPGLEIAGSPEKVEKPLDFGPSTSTEKGMSPAQAAILRVAEASKGMKPWQSSEYKEYLEDGKVGGGAAVVEMLRLAGIKVQGANPKNIMARLVAQGWTIHGAKDAQAGDVVVGGKLNTNWRRGGTNSEIAVVGKDGKVLYNDPESTQLAEGKFDKVFSEKEFGQQVWVLRPPENATESTSSNGKDVPGAKVVNEDDLPTGAKKVKEEDLPTGAKKDKGDNSMQGASVPTDKVGAGYDFTPVKDDSQPDKDKSTLSVKAPEGERWQEYWQEHYRTKYQELIKARDAGKGVPVYMGSEAAPKYNDPDLAPDPMGIRKGPSVRSYYDTDLRPDPMGIRAGQKPVGYNEGIEYRDLWYPGMKNQPRSWKANLEQPDKSAPEEKRDPRTETENPDQRDRPDQRESENPSDRRDDGSDRLPAGDKPLRGKIIALAAGHGGHDSGASHNGWKEKDFTLMMTRKVAAELERLGATVKMTRDSDEYISPENIKNKFNQFKPDIALAIHADSAGANTTGILTMYSKQDSKRLAEVLQQTLVAETGSGDRGTKYQTHSWKGKPFQSTNADAPSVFLELANLGSKSDAQRIREPGYQDQLAKAVGKGVIRYLGASRDYTPRQDDRPQERSRDAGDRADKATLEGRVFEDRVASIYTMGAGTKTANGEIYRPYNDLTAAHRTLPFGTRVRVTDTQTGKSVIVRITDDGPHVKGRHIDLSMKSAQAIGLDNNRGLAKVNMEIVEMGDGKRTFHGKSSYMGPGLRNMDRERSRYGPQAV